MLMHKASKQHDYEAELLENEAPNGGSVEPAVQLASARREGVAHIQEPAVQVAQPSFAIHLELQQCVPGRLVVCWQRRFDELLMLVTLTAKGSEIVGIELLDHPRGRSFAHKESQLHE